MGCFQVFEDHEGIEADLLRRLAVLGGRLEARSAGQRPALLVVSPRAALRGPIAAACRTALLPGIRPCRSWSSRQPAPSAMVQAPATPSLSPAGPETGCGWPLQRELVTVQGQVVERQEFPWRLSPGFPPQAALAVAGALLLLGVPRNSSPPPSHKIPPPPLDKPTILIYNKNTPPQGVSSQQFFLFLSKIGRAVPPEILRLASNLRRTCGGGVQRPT